MWGKRKEGDARRVLERHKEVDEANTEWTLLLIQLFFPPCTFQEYYRSTLLTSMAKFLAELLGCTLPDKGTPPLFECRRQPHPALRPSKQRPTIFGTLTNERALFDNSLCGLSNGQQQVGGRSSVNSQFNTPQSCAAFVSLTLSHAQTNTTWPNPPLPLPTHIHKQQQRGYKHQLLISAQFTYRTDADI
ncbi:Ras-GEF domain-containing family member 1B-A [Larimichthys crocea]|uniref:Uncharacterized protein n=1 Tax=Larimichthys crocea TaxID=215358 RepID=A0ACD3Q817_LARCR|nr:Ras-GEF domain-containing family member 1B-A [Larimichthys crocea]